MSLSNINLVWKQSDRVDRDEGMVAYDRYRITLNRLAISYGYPLGSVVGAFAALSPNNDYMGNLRSVSSLLKGGSRTTTYHACRDRALRCLQGEPFLSFTKGPKTRSFYQNIMDPSDTTPVTIDGHAYCIWVGKRMTMKSVVRTNFSYREISDDYRTVARGLNIVPCQLQAILWFTWKRINKIIYQPQMNMFRPGDQWNLDMRPEDIPDFA